MTRVLCVRRLALEKVQTISPSSFTPGSCLRPAIDGLIHEFMPRDSIEKDVRYKQLIPYVVVHVPTEDQLVLVYDRGSNGGDKRLHNFKSLGFGGHVEEDDWEGTITRSLRKCACRELREEGVPVDDGLLSFRGVVNNDSDAVGMVHFGFVFELTLLRADFAPSEEIIAPEFLPARELWPMRKRFERWSNNILRSRPRFLG